MVPLQTILPLTVQPSGVSECWPGYRNTGDITFTTKLIRRRILFFFLQDIFSIDTDPDLGLLYFRDLSLIYLICLSILLELTSFLALQRLWQYQSAQINLEMQVLLLMILMIIWLTQNSKKFVIFISVPLLTSACDLHTAPVITWDSELRLILLPPRTDFISSPLA